PLVRRNIAPERFTSWRSAVKHRSLVLVLVTLMALAAGAASANTATPRVDRREVRQHARIHQGVRSGELTRGEALRLRADQGHIRRMERRAKRDGVVTPRERARLTRAQNRESARIYAYKHNARTR